MNLFILSDKFEQLARDHVDRHVVKMPLEAAQLACTALHCVGIVAPYRKTHVNHPCAIWTRETAANFVWTCRYGIAVAREYSYRYGKRHKCEDVLLACIEHAGKFALGGLTAFAQAMPEAYRQDDAVEAYRAYYRGEKRHLAQWSKRDVPSWWE